MPELHKRATLTDVARLAGVSVTTASYILNGRTEQMRISGETATKVRAAMDQLEYRPNWSARSLRSSTTRTVAIVSDYLAGGGFAGELITGANAAARELDHLLVIGETLGDAETERLVVEEMLSRQVDGIIYATLTACEVNPPSGLRSEATVLLNCRAPGMDLFSVVPDDEQGGRLAAETLIAGGLRGPVHVVGEDPTPGATAGRDRLRGITAALAAAGHELAGVVACPWDVVPAREAVEAWLAQGDVHPAPAALICLNDRVGIGTYQALRTHGLRVPDDVEVVSFDGTEMATWLIPRLTSIRLPLAEMGARAVQHVLDPGGRRGRVERIPLVLGPGESLRTAAR